MPKLHFSSTQSPPLHVYFSPGDPAFTLGRAGAGNRVELDCSEDIYCRVTWEKDGVWFRCEPGAVMNCGGQDCCDCRIDEELDLFICGRSFHCALMEDGATFLPTDAEKVNSPPSGMDHFQPPDPGAVISLDDFIAEPLIRLAVLGGKDAEISAWLQDLSTLKAAENGKGLMTRCRQIPGEISFQSDARGRQALREFQQGNRVMDARLSGETNAEETGGGGLGRYVFLIRRPELPGRLLEILEPPENLEGEAMESFRNFCFHAHALWVFLPADPQEQFGLLNFLTGVDLPLQGAVQVVIPDDISPEADPVLLRFFDSVCGPGKVSVTQRSALLAHSGLPFLTALADKVAVQRWMQCMKHSLQTRCPWVTLRGRRQKALREARAQVEGLEEVSSELKALQQRYRRRRFLEGGLLCALLFGLSLGLGAGFTRYWEKQTRVLPDVRAEMTVLRGALAEENWNLIFNELDQALAALREAPTDRAQLIRESRAGLEEKLEELANRQIGRIPEAPETTYLNVLDALRAREAPYRELATDSWGGYQRVLNDYRTYDSLRVLQEAWGDQRLSGALLLEACQEYLDLEKPLMKTEVLGLHTWLVSPRPLLVELLRVSWWDKEEERVPGKLKGLRVSSRETILEVDKVILSTEDLGTPVTPCTVDFDVHPPGDEVYNFRFELTLSQWEKWGLPRGETLDGELQVTAQEFFSQPNGAIKRLLALNNEEGNPAGTLDLILDMELGALPAALPTWPLR